MSVLVVGSVAYDSVVTPSGSRQDSLGGSAMYFSIAASCFTAVSLVGVVGEDFGSEHIALLKARGVDLSGLEQAQGRTFRWSGEYSDEDVNTRETLDTQLNVFADFSPQLSDEHRRQSHLFLGNIDPELQMDVLGQMESRPALVGLDSMNFWIESKRDALERAVGSVDVLFMDEGEARQFSGEPNLVRAAHRIGAMGPSGVVIKRGEHGALLFNDGSVFAAPAFPLERVVDPTGAGDSFAGGFMGYLAASGDISAAGLRRAAILGSVMGSFCVEDFSAQRLAAVNIQDIQERFRSLSEITRFEPLKEGESLPHQEGVRGIH